MSGKIIIDVEELKCYIEIIFVTLHRLLVFDT